MGLARRFLQTEYPRREPARQRRSQEKSIQGQGVMSRAPATAERSIRSAADDDRSYLWPLALGMPGRTLKGVLLRSEAMPSVSAEGCDFLAEERSDSDRVAGNRFREH